MNVNSSVRDEVQQCGQYETVVDNEDASSGKKALTASEEVEARFVHRDARKMFAWCPWMRHVPVYGEACEAFGPKCTWSLGLSYVMCKGVADYLVRGGVYAMFMDRFNVGIMRYQRLGTIANTGWSIKAFTAVLCDSFAFMGYTKRWYILISVVAGAVFALVYGLMPPKPSSADTAAAFLFLTCFTKANFDILAEGHYSRLMRRSPKAGTSLITWIWWYIIIGSLISSAINGPLGDAKIPHISAFISVPLEFLTGVFFVFNWYGERTNREERAEDARRMHEELLIERARVAGQNANGGEHDDGTAHPYKDMHPEKAYSDEEARQRSPANDPLALDDELRMDQTNAAPRKQNGESDELILPEPIPCMCGLFEFNKEVVTRNWRVVVYSVIMTCGVVAMTCGNILADTLGLLIICVVVSVICCGASFWALPPVIAKANVFMFISMTSYLQMPGALDPFYTAEPDCVPDGPHFSLTFYNTVASIIGNIAGITGVALFRFIFFERSYCVTYIVTITAYVVASVFDIIIVKRWNITIGIPDHAMYICGDAIINQVCYLINFMPMTILLSRLCPRGSESVVYALMAGFANFGQSVSASISSVLMEYAWPVSNEPPCNFNNVPWLLFVGHICTPLIVIPLSFILLPNARICDNIDVDGNVIQKEVKHEMKMQAKSTQAEREPQADDNVQKSAA